MTSPVAGSIDVAGRERAFALGVDELDASTPAFFSAST
jgi:hypothetical protein